MTLRFHDEGDRFTVAFTKADYNDWRCGCPVSWRVATEGTSPDAPLWPWTPLGALALSGGSVTFDKETGDVLAQSPVFQCFRILQNEGRGALDAFVEDLRDWAEAQMSNKAGFTAPWAR